MGAGTAGGPGSPRRDIAMVFQEFSLIPQMSVGHNILLTREPKGRLRIMNDRALDPRGHRGARPCGRRDRP